MRNDKVSVSLPFRRYDNQLDFSQLLYCQRMLRAPDKAPEVSDCGYGWQLASAAKCLRRAASAMMAAVFRD